MSMCSSFAPVEYPNELVVPPVNGNGRGKPIGDGWIVGEVLKDPFAIQCFTFECGENVDAVKNLIWAGV
jgi:hypothetical protein